MRFYVLLALACGIGCTVPSCSSTIGEAAGVKMSGEITAVKAALVERQDVQAQEITGLRASLAAFELKFSSEISARDIRLEASIAKIGNIGGGGDSVASWLSIGGLILLALGYPLWSVIRGRVLGWPVDPLKVRRKRFQRDQDDATS